MVSFNITVRQMTKNLSKKLPKCFSEKKTYQCLPTMLCILYKLKAL